MYYDDVLPSPCNLLLPLLLQLRLVLANGGVV